MLTAFSCHSMQTVLARVAAIPLWLPCVCDSTYFFWSICTSFLPENSSLASLLPLYLFLLGLCKTLPLVPYILSALSNIRIPLVDPSWVQCSSCSFRKPGSESLGTDWLRGSGKSRVGSRQEVAHSRTSWASLAGGSLCLHKQPGLWDQTGLELRPLCINWWHGQGTQTRLAISPWSSSKEDTDFTPHLGSRAAICSFLVGISIWLSQKYLWNSVARSGLSPSLLTLNCSKVLKLV